jgi:transcriptional antiterminator NusG
VSFKWYVVHVYSGYEQKVKLALEDKIANSGSADLFDQVLVPTEHVIELVNGKKRESSRKFYPGYILLRMDLNDETWHIVTNTPKVTGFLGGKNKPAPISDAEAAAIIERMEQGKNKPQPKYYFEPGDDVRVTDGPFTNFNGTVETSDPDKGKVRVHVSIFGRATPVELDFVQVTKI